jgi:hypothetical protein
LSVQSLRRAGAGCAGWRNRTPGGSSFSSAGPPGAAVALNMRTLVAAAGLVLAAAFVLLAFGAEADAAVGAPHNIIVFPQRDYVSATGYAIDVPVTVKVFHPGQVLPASTATNVTPVEDPANHPGGVWWEGVTPDIRAGDTVEITQSFLDGTTATDTTVVANVTASRPIQTGPNTVEVHGGAGRHDYAALGASARPARAPARRPQGRVPAQRPPHGPRGGRRRRRDVRLRSGL